MLWDINLFNVSDKIGFNISLVFFYPKTLEALIFSFATNLTGGEPEAVDLGSLGQPGFMVTLGDYAYFSDMQDDVVVRFDATLAVPVLETVATGIDSPGGIFFEGDHLYVNGYLSQTVFRIDVTGDFPSPTVKVLELDNPRGLILYEGEFFSPFYVENKIVKGAFELLPVTWEGFSVTPVADKSVRLDWSVSAMEGHDYFSVERSADGTNWRPLTTDIHAPGAADVVAEQSRRTGAKKVFWSNDSLPLTGTSHYRIRQTDFDGSSSLTEMATVALAQTKLTAYPNPISPNEPLTLSGLKDGQIVQLHNITGKMVRQFRNSGHYPLKELSPGVYLLVAGEERVRVVVR